MAKSGAPSTMRNGAGPARPTPAASLVEAAVETLKEDGFVGASARAIAERAGSNQGLIFYHFGSVTNLLLAALDDVSAERLQHYGEAVDRVGSLGELVEVATDIFRTDLDAGHITVLVEMIAGASSVPGLGAEVAERIHSWREFARSAIDGALGEDAARLGRPRRRHRPRRRRPLPRSRDAQPPRRRSPTGTRAVRPGRAARRPAGDSAGAPSATTTERATRRQKRSRHEPDRNGQPRRAGLDDDTGLDVVTGAFSYSGRAIAAAVDRSRAAGSNAHRTSRPRPRRLGHRGAAPRLRRPARPGRVAPGSDHPLQHLLGALRPKPDRPRPGRGQLADPLPGGEAGRHPADRPRQHHQSEHRLTAALLQGEGTGGAGPGRVPRCRTRSSARPSCSAGTGCCSTTSPGCCATCPCSRSAGAGDYRIRGIHVDDLARLCVAQGAERRRHGDRCRRPRAPDLPRAGDRHPRRGRQSGQDRPGSRGDGPRAVPGGRLGPPRRPPHQGRVPGHGGRSGRHRRSGDGNDPAVGVAGRPRPATSGSTTPTSWTGTSHR